MNWYDINNDSKLPEAFVPVAVVMNTDRFGAWSQAYLNNAGEWIFTNGQKVGDAFNGYKVLAWAEMELPWHIRARQVFEMLKREQERNKQDNEPAWKSQPINGELPESGEIVTAVDVNCNWFQAKCTWTGTWDNIRWSKVVASEEGDPKMIAAWRPRRQPKRLVVPTTVLEVGAVLAV